MDMFIFLTRRVNAGMCMPQVSVSSENNLGNWPSFLCVHLCTPGWLACEPAGIPICLLSIVGFQGLNAVLCAHVSYPPASYRVPYHFANRRVLEVLPQN